MFATAPGKVVLSGEYAVLDGAPALVMAVDRRAEVAIRRLDSGLHRVTAPGLAAAERRFTVRSGAFDWQDGLAAWTLLESCWRAAGFVAPGPLAIRLDTLAFRDPLSGSKIGVGSSAALSAALCTAMCAILPGHRDVRQIAMLAHRDFQHGKGSGVDVAASFSGGVIEFRMGDPSGQERRWPDGLRYEILWSGIEADTSMRVARLAGSDKRVSRLALADASSNVATAWQGGSAGAVMASLASYVAALEHFSADHGLGVFDAGHAALAALAPRRGLVYKPCGAGGGDIGIVLGTDAEAIETFAGLATDHGFTRTGLSIDAVGARTEATGSD